MSGRRERIAADHPCLEGHFPGNPLAPGALILGRVVRAYESDCAGRRVRGFSRVKFFKPLGPGDEFDIVIEPAGNERAGFRVDRGGVTCIAGVLVLDVTGR